MTELNKTFLNIHKHFCKKYCIIFIFVYIVERNVYIIKIGFDVKKNTLITLFEKKK